MRGIQYPSNLKQEVTAKRNQGYSLNELVEFFKLPKSTIQGWVFKQELPKQSIAIIQNKIYQGRLKGNKSTNRRNIKKSFQKSNFNLE